jgi:TolB-like protein/Tfp pilus assembly protein PilF
MFTDIVGYTALTQSNEAQAMEVLERHNRLLRPFFPRFHGREVKAIGDSFFVEFESALDALKCAAEIQSYLHDYNVSSKEEWKIKLRIGIHLGDVIHQGGDVFGDAVNIASRIEQIAGSEGICVSQQVYDQVQNKFDLTLLSLGEKTLKNVSRPVQVYSVQMPWEQTVTPEAATYPTNRIAVLPFASLSPDPNDGYFADGITDEIISAVSGISGLRVISRTSVIGYKGTAKKVKEIGKELEVGSILEGTFKKAGNRIRVTTQLIKVADDEHLWAQNYDRELNDVFEVQSDVAKQVADALKVRILSLEMERIRKKPTANTNAYALYLKGRYLWNKRDVENVKKAAECFEQAVKEDPNFALGYVGQTDCLLWLRNYWGTDLEAKLVEPKALLAKALEIDPDLAEAHATNGNVLMYEYKPRQAEVEFRRAIELNPNYASAHHWYSHSLMAQLRWDEAYEQAEKAMELDPLTSAVTINLVHVCYHKRDYGRALDLAKRVAMLDPSYSGAHFFMTMIYGRMGRHEDARREADAWVELVQRWLPFARLGGDALVVAMKEDKEAMRKLIPEIEAHYMEAGFSAYSAATGFFLIGDNDKGFEWLERSYAMREADLMEIKNDQNADGVRNDPRYLDLLKRLGLD